MININENFVEFVRQLPCVVAWLKENETGKWEWVEENEDTPDNCLLTIDYLVGVLAGKCPYCEYSKNKEIVDGKAYPIILCRRQGLDIGLEQRLFVFNSATGETTEEWVEENEDTDILKPP